MRRCLASAALSVLAASPAAAAPRTYAIDPAASSVRVHVGKSGAFSFAGHTHEVAAPALRGSVIVDEAILGASSVSVEFDAAALTVLPAGEPAGDAPKVEAVMRGPKVLDAARFAAITFRSTAVSGRAATPGAYDLQVVGDVTIHGVTKRVTLPLRATLAGATLAVSGETALRQTDFGLQPVSVAGVVKVKDELGLALTIVARASP
jgi:polyisoprenoid-binding protein YceI